MRVFIFILSYMFCTMANAQILPSYGGERAGQSAFTFLKNDMSVRSAGMGSASAALPGDRYSGMQNPAGLSSLSSSSFALSHIQLGGNLSQIGILTSIPNKKTSSAWGLSLNRIQTPAYTERTEFQPEGTGYKLYSSQTSAGLSYSKQLTEQFQLGITLKSISESYTTGGQNGTYNAFSAAADVGFLYTTDLKDLRFAVLLRNFGGSSNLRGSYQASTFNRFPIQSLESNTLPTEFAMALSFIAYEKNNSSLRLAAQLVHPNDNAENYRIGAEFLATKDFAVRMGYRLNERGQSWPVGGLGWVINMGQYKMQCDFAVQKTDVMGWKNTIGLVFYSKKAKT